MRALEPHHAPTIAKRQPAQLVLDNPIDPDHHGTPIRPPVADDTDGMGRKITAGIIVIAVVFGGLGLWSVTASLSGAIIAPGFIQVEGSRKAIQHLEGGIVKEILVKDGQQVKQGALLIRLHDKTVGANLRLVQGQVDELVAKRARLLAQQDGAADLSLPQNLAVNATNGSLAEIVGGQKALLDAKRKNREMEINLLRQQQLQLRTQIVGMKEQDASKERQLAFFEDELKGLRSLFERGLTSKNRLMTQERSAETVRGERAVLTGNIAANEMKINELELQILRLDSTSQEKVAEELRGVEAELNVVSEKLVTNQDQAERIEIRSPRNGRVLKLAVHTPGAVIKPGETIMEVVPDDDTLVVGAQVSPADIDKVLPDAPARLRLSAFNQRTTPELDGKVTRVSADLVTDQRTGANFYEVTISIPPEQIQHLEGLTLKPGMPAESMILTGDRSPLSYLLKPLTDSLSRAAKESD
jgi:HlyD family type I secretion membrane fusion protein